MAGSGIVHSGTFTPSAPGDLLVTATFTAQFGGSDWGAGGSYKLFYTQSSVTTYGDVHSVSTTRRRFTAAFLFVGVGAGASIEYGLFGQASGAAAIEFRDIDVSYELLRAT